VQANPGFGQAGAVVDILGNNLIGTTKATFNGTPATFTVVSSTELKTTVPTVLTTTGGFVQWPTRWLHNGAPVRAFSAYKAKVFEPTYTDTGDQAQHGKPPAVSLKRLSSEF